MSGLFMALAACSPAEPEAAPAAEPPAAAAPATATPTDTTPISSAAAEVADCSAAFAVMGNIDPASTRNDASTVWFQEYLNIQMSMSAIPDRPAPARMSAEIRARIEHWKNQPEPARAARAEACATKF